ncbi:MAG: RDD family protein [Microbacteriaceae bacterium]
MAKRDATPTRFGDLAPSRWPGERLGLPASGRGSVGRIGRRIAALSIDWAMTLLLCNVFLTLDPWFTAGVFALLQIIFIPTLGGSIGHRLVGMRVVPIRGGYVGWWRPIVRSVLLALVIPALVWDSDQRGFHDSVAGTVLIRF